MGKKKRLQLEKQQQHAILPHAEAAASPGPFVGISHAEMLDLKNKIKQRNERIQMFERIRARYFRRTVMKILMLQRFFEKAKLLKIFKYKRVLFIKKVVKWRPFIVKVWGKQIKGTR